MLATIFVCAALVNAVSANIPPGRPDPSARTYTSTAINSLIDNLTPLFRDPDLAVSIV